MFKVKTPEATSLWGLTPAGAEVGQGACILAAHW